MRVLVTRPETDAQRTARRLEALGHECLAVPLMELRPLPFEWPDATPDVIVVTSASAIAALPDVEVAALSTPVFAVGERTADAARTRGFFDVRGGGGDATALLATIAAALPASARLLYLAGVDRKPVLEAGLTDRGYAVDVREVYEVVPVDTLPVPLAQALDRGAIDAALHYSRRSAAIFCRLVVNVGFGPAVVAMRHHCLSADAAKPLHALGAKYLTIAEHPTEAALLATCR